MTIFEAVAWGWRNANHTIGRMPIFVVYDHPSDYPEGVVIRLWLGDEGTDHCWLCDDVEEARLSLDSAGLLHLHRTPGDDPCIVGTWL